MRVPLEAILFFPLLPADFFDCGITTNRKHLFMGDDDDVLFGTCVRSVLRSAVACCCRSAVGVWMLVDNVSRSVAVHHGTLNSIASYFCKDAQNRNLHSAKSSLSMQERRCGLNSQNETNV